MALVTADVVMLLPAGVRRQACHTSRVLAQEMRRHGHASHFLLGEDYPGSAPGVCEPHFSLFMLSIDTSEVESLTDGIRAVAGGTAPLQATAAAWRHNPCGAPELHFTPTPEWLDLQRRVVAAAEPARRGRLRHRDPAGEDIAATVARLQAHDPASPQLRQLLRYGYDEITDERDARFSPHITFAWPVGDFRVGFEATPAPHTFNSELDEIAVYTMDRFGTCTTRLAAFPLSGRRVAAASGLPFAG